MSWTKISAVVAAPMIMLGFAGAAIGEATPASAAPIVVPHTFSGTVTSSTVAGGNAVGRTLNCAALGQGYVEGAGEGRTTPRAAVVEDPNVVHFFIAKDTEGYAFLSRIVTSVSIRIEALPWVKDVPYQITLYCTNEPREAWRVFG